MTEKEYKELARSIANGVGAAFKFGQGVVGKSTNVVIGIIVLGFLTMHYLAHLGGCSTNTILIVFFAVLVVFALWFPLLAFLCIKYPHLNLEGSHLVQWKKTDLAAKGKIPTDVIETTAVTETPLSLEATEHPEASDQ